MNGLIYIVMSYFLGSIPFGLLIGKLTKGIDVREHGSGNLGATNVFRVVGKKWGITVLLLDAFKGFVAVRLPFWFGSSDQQSAAFLTLLAIVAILGHTFPIWLRFKGGKGVATSLGVFLALIPKATLISFAVFAVVFGLSRIISLGSLIAAISFPVAVCILYRVESGFIAYAAVSIILALFIFYTHRANIQRLLKGEEKKLF